MRNLIYVLLFTNYLWGADKPAPKAPARSPASVQYKKSTTMEFDGKNVDGNVVSPDSSDVEGDKNIKFDPLLEGRKDFKREFKRSSGVSR